MHRFTVAIVAGGRSSRMGTNKSFVKLSGKPLIEHVIARVAGLGQAETILIANDPGAYAYLGLPIFGDVLPGHGSLGGIYTALHFSQMDSVLIVGCDMPFVNPALLRYMLDLRASEGGPFDVIVPRAESHPEGLHAIYSRACLDPIRTQLDAGSLRVIGVYPLVRVRYVDEPEYQRFDAQGLSFFNINTPEDLERAQDIAANPTDT